MEILSLRGGVWARPSTTGCEAPGVRGLAARKDRPMLTPVPPTRCCARGSHIYRVDDFLMVGPTGRQMNAYGGRCLYDDAQARFEPL